MKLGMACALFVGVGLLASPASALQQDSATLTTDDVLRTPDSATNVNAAASTAAAERAANTAEATSKVASPGYTKFVAPSGYSFELPDGWKPVENLESKGAPSSFKYDAVFQDPSTGAVLSAVSVDRTQLGSAIDITDATAINSLLSTMLNPANQKQGVKIFRHVAGESSNKTKWLRIKAQGNGQATNGQTVDTTFWVQLVQSDGVLALVAVGYPTAQEDTASVSAFHTVRTLEMDNAAGPTGGSAFAGSTAADVQKSKGKKDGEGSVRKQ